jgi:membrane protein DedA with SNARE-associated domain
VIIYAYSGACLWVLFFIGIGYIFGEQWQQVFNLAERYLKFLFIGLGCFLAGFLILKRLNRSK